MLVYLVKDNKKGWLIDPNDDLLNAMTGNFNKAFTNSNSSSSSNSSEGEALLKFKVK